MSLISRDYYSTSELADLKGVHVGSVRRWVQQGLAPHHEVLGGMYWFEKKAADAWQKPKIGRKSKL